jgi:hypothetical protein
VKHVGLDSSRLNLLASPQGGILNGKAGTVHRRVFSGVGFVLLIAVAGFALITTPVAEAEKPIRTPREFPSPFVLPGGVVCAFDVLLVPRRMGGGGAGIFRFADGRTVFFANAELTVTNLETGRTYIHHSDYREIDTFPDADTGLDVVSGNILAWFFPGDQGPFGEVGENGENGGLFAFVGKTTRTFDPNTSLFTSFSHQGKMTDVCAALTG